MTATRITDWLEVRPTGLHVRPGGFTIDPLSAVDRAVITHGHTDHARPGHAHVLATAETLAIMRHRYGGDPTSGQALGYGEALTVGDVTLRLVPAGHVLGSAQVVVDYRGQRVVVSGDYKRRADPTCAPFEPVTADLFVSEATFALPVFRHPPVADEIARLMRSLALFPERAHVVGVYALGKCQRLIAELRRAGYDRPIYLHGALLALSHLYESLGVALGPLVPVADVERRALAGQVVLAPPLALADRWSRRLPEPLPAAASGWMRVRQRARQRGVELPLVISDHADWDELLATVKEVAAGEVWVTHGREEALIFAARSMGLSARALSLVGREDDGE